MEECPDCGGAGTVDCDECGTRDAIICETCSGDGEIESMEEEINE
jgi:hypothetical protein